MTTSRHTPGPWGQFGPDSICSMSRASLPIATINTDNPEAEANARLIDHAPAMYEACQAIAALADGQGRLNMMQVAGMARAILAEVEKE